MKGGAPITATVPEQKYELVKQMILTQIFRKATLVGAGMMLTAGLATAGEKGMMHCFAFTPIKEATPADWDAFWKATDALPKKNKTVLKVWYGKLRAPLAQWRILDPAAAKQARAGEKDVTSKIAFVSREYGVCMVLKDEASLKAYTESPYHKEWTAAYEKVRVAGTTTYDIIGQ